MKVLGAELSSLEANVDNAIHAPHILKSTADYPEREPVPPILDTSPTPWGAYLRNFAEVEFQSDLGEQSDGGRKLVDDPRFRNDFTLWTYLLEFRKRQYGDAGVAMVWAAVRKRRLMLPTEGCIADTIWPIFLQAALKDKQMLEDICQYADNVFDSSGKRWRKFYVYIMQHIVLNEQQCTIVPWHERLIDRHPPGPAVFSRFVRNIVVMGGDLEALKLLYKTKFYRTHNYKTYGKIIPTLIGREDFHAAMQWHLFLVRRGDLPLNRKVVQPLIHHFDIYDPWKARKLKNSLVARAVSFADSTSDDLENEIISREMMNLVHGKAFGIEPKKYSDRLGARWFATNWISLDLAINTIHALGVEGIGPLSLHAIALRERDASGVVRRIDQLKELGISIGDSAFSRAVQSFARNGEIEYLQALLTSDQHPDSYDDRQLQDNLLAAYSRAGDWNRYRLTAAVQVVGSHGSRVNRYNIIQRANVLRGDRTAFFKMLEEMRVQRVPVAQKTIRYILNHFLPIRTAGNGPDPRRKSLDDLQTTISILLNLMKFGSFVHPTSWREIIRRLGMLGRFDDLEKLCFWLVAWYKPKSNLKRSMAVRAPAQIPTSHSLHPLRILFSDPLQRALVEWAFKHEPLRPFRSTVALDVAEQSAHHYTRGVKLLRQLQDEGVYIDVLQIRRALRNRFAILYNPGRSRVARNNLLRQQNLSRPQDMVAHLNKAWAADIWLDAHDLE